MLAALLGSPLVGAAALALVGSRRLAAGVHVAAAALTAASAVAVGLSVWRAGALEAPGWALRADPLSAFMGVLVAGVALAAAATVPGYLAEEEQAGRVSRARARRFLALSHVFVFTMLLAVVTNNVGVMWVAVEGTTLASVFLITLQRSRASLEAAYKYLLICSVGIGIAFVGTVLLYYADVGALGTGARGLEWSALVAVAPRLPSRLVAVAFVCLLVGYGTKAGLVPMHTWLPDAHSEAPAPVSALMSGVLLAVGLYAVFRFKPVADAALGPGFAGGLLLAFGLGSMTVAAAFLWAPRNYKRMLAYSSVEHVGLVCLGVAFGGAWGPVGALLHLVNHALAKSTLFLLAGRVLQGMGSAEVAKVRALGRAMPWTAGAFLAATLALVGLPPFGLFLSEVMILRAGFGGRAGWAAGVALALLVIAFGGILRTVNRMLYGEDADGPRARERFTWSLLPAVVNLALLVVLGVAFPPGLAEALRRVAAVLQ